MIPITDLKAGISFKLDGQLWRVVKYEHTKMGRGTATIKVKAKNLENGSVLDKSFISGAKVEPVETRRKSMTYLYSDETIATFMDPDTYEQVEIPMKIIDEDSKYLLEGESVNVLFLVGEIEKPLSVDLPVKLEFEVAEADPGVKGNSAANMYKNVTLSNGLVIRAPLFIKQGDKVRVDTRNGEYVERV